MFRTNKFVMMKDVKIILSCLLKDFESDDSLEGLIYAIRDLINLIDSDLAPFLVAIETEGSYFLLLPVFNCLRPVREHLNAA